MGRLIRRPFKGAFFYEWQVGPFVLQYFSISTPHRVNVWRDPYWRARP